uniref:Uncharacterized protein n=1 Tax=Cucumis sativus TaxID=3659 RepID=A0A0A0LWE3_CUCSA
MHCFQSLFHYNFPISPNVLSLNTTAPNIHHHSPAFHQTPFEHSPCIWIFKFRNQTPFTKQINQNPCKSPCHICIQSIPNVDKKPIWVLFFQLRYTEKLPPNGYYRRIELPPMNHYLRI